MDVLEWQGHLYLTMLLNNKKFPSIAGHYLSSESTYGLMPYERHRWRLQTIKSKLFIAIIQYLT